MAGCIKSGFIRKKSLCCQKPQPQPELSSTLWADCCADESSSADPQCRPFCTIQIYNQHSLPACQPASRRFCIAVSAASACRVLAAYARQCLFCQCRLQGRHATAATCFFPLLLLQPEPPKIAPLFLLRLL